MMAVTMIAMGAVVINRDMPEKQRVYWRNAAAWELRHAGMDLTLKGGHFPLAQVEHDSERWHYEQGLEPQKYELWVRHNEHGGMFQIERGTLRNVCIAVLQHIGSIT